MNLPSQELHIIKDLKAQNDKLKEQIKKRRTISPEKPLKKDVSHDWPFILFACLGMLFSAALHFYVKPVTPAERIETALFMLVLFSGLIFIGALIRNNYNATN